VNSALWHDLLTRWNADLLRWPDLAKNVPPEVLTSRWLGFPAAPAAAITAAEARLGYTLSPSYCEFLKVTNGWRHLGWPHDQLRSVEDVDWFRVRNQAWIDAWLVGVRTYDPPPVSDERYFTYGETQRVTDLREEYLPSLLEVSTTGDGVIMLLNPHVTFPDGEWEAWDFGNWYPGAQRYRSFWELMQAAYHGFLALLEWRTRC
jgi:SMI1/KNR4 family protein SUKH-1